MKKLLLSVVLLSATLIACGPSAEEKEAAQEANETMVNEKVDEIIQELETTTPEAEAVDSAAADTATAE